MPTSSKTPPSKAADWNCGVCGRANPSTGEKCFVCGSAKGRKPNDRISHAKKPGDARSPRRLKNKEESKRAPPRAKNRGPADEEIAAGLSASVAPEDSGGGRPHGYHGLPSEVCRAGCGADCGVRCSPGGHVRRRQP